MKVSQVTAKPLAVPRSWPSNLPKYGEIPHVPFRGANHRSYSAHQAEEEADHQLFNCLVVAGFGERSVPWDSEKVAACLAGAALYATTRQRHLLSASDCEHYRRQSGDRILFGGLWHIAWRGLNLTRPPIPFSVSLKESLLRLLAAQRVGDQWENRTYRIWYDFDYCDTHRGWGELKHSIYKEAPAIADFPLEDQPFLRALAEGMDKMLTLFQEYYSAERRG